MLHQQAKETLVQTNLTNDVFDIIIVGAGVVGCAMARHFTLQGAKVGIVEKASDILDGASKANSAILHTGFDAPPNSIELLCIKDGYEEYKKIYKQLGLPFEKTGAFVVAWNEEELAKLEGILAKAHQNGIKNTKIITAKNLAKKEPNLAKNALGAISIPDEAIIDPWSAPYAYLHQAIENGAKVFLSCEVMGADFNDDEWQIKTSRGTLKTHYVINCAGLYGDKLNEAILGRTDFNITPRKGQFVVFDKAAASLANSIILPVPTARTKGVVVCKTIFGNLLVGPTAQDQQSRSDTSTDEASLNGLIASGIEKIPSLKNMPITAIYAGLRPATQYKEYQIEIEKNRNWITVGGIRSTGLSAALGIAKYVYKKYAALGLKHSKIKNPKLPKPAPILAQNEKRDWQKKNHGEIICHCEMVSEREILAALSGSLKANSMAGLKRQTRATMGRCQGFYCSSRLAQITDGYFENSTEKEAAK
jgi:glycerol-3-phosphate dehydrogenase